MLRALILSIVLVVLTAAVGLAIVHADWINLKDGGRLNGTIVRQDEKELTIHLTDGGVMTVQMRRVDDFFQASPLAPEAEKKSDQQGQPANSDPVYRRYPEHLSGPLVDRRFGEMVVAIPRNFNLKRGAGSMPGFERHLLGVYSDPTSGAEVSITGGKLPLEAQDLADLSRRLRKEVENERGSALRRLEPAEIDGHPALVGEVESRAGDPDTIVVFAWIAVAPQRCYCIAVQVPEDRFAGVENVYRSLVQSFRHQPADRNLEGAQPAPETSDDHPDQP